MMISSVFRVLNFMTSMSLHLIVTASTARNYSDMQEEEVAEILYYKFYMSVTSSYN
jgi:hypothetical protein